MSGRVKVDSTRLLLDDFFQVEEAHVRHKMTDGSMSERLRILCFERGDSAAALVLNRDRQTCVLVRQFRYPAYKRGDGWLIEIPAGRVEEGESASRAIRRELLEEVGYRAAELHPIATFLPSPGGTSERILLYLAVVGDDDRIQAGGGNPAESEDIEILEVSLAAISDYLASGEITDGKTLLALTWLELRLARGDLPGGTDHG